MTLALAVCTYRRPASLARLLEHLTRLRLASGERPVLRVNVVDSDVEGGEGLAVCRALADDYPYEVRAELAPAAGISSARNAVCRLALAGAPDLVAFLDDDEWPAPDWLAELLRVQAEHDADAVGGPTRSVFPEGADPALAANPYYGADMNLPDGAPCTLQAGGNFLMRAEALARLGPDFFPLAFERSGSEDLAFFMRLAALGARMHWARHALVHEEVPPERLHPDWLRDRVLVVANGRVRAAQMLDPGLLPSLVRGTKTGGLLVVAEAFALAARLKPSLRTRAEEMRGRGRGKLLAHLGREVRRRESDQPTGDEA